MSMDVIGSLPEALVPLMVRIGRAELIQALTSAGYLVLGVVLLWSGLAQGTPPLVLAAIAVTIGGSALAWFLANRRFHLIHDTPTARIRSAAQGYVELMGSAALSPGQPSPVFDGLPPCVWFEVVISERATGQGSRSTWVRTSDETFVLRDETGECIIDPDHAEVHMAHVRGWTSGSRSYRARFLRQGEPLYAIGMLETVRGADGGFDQRADVAHLLREWKRDSGDLLRRFDDNRDGRICEQEWSQAVSEAEHIVTAQHKERLSQPGVNVMRSPGRSLPYILSNRDPEALALRFRHWAWFHAAAFMLGLAGASWQFLG